MSDPQKPAAKPELSPEMQCAVKEAQKTVDLINMHDSSLPGQASMFSYNPDLDAMARNGKLPIPDNCKQKTR